MDDGLHRRAAPGGPKSLRNLERTLGYFDGLDLDIRMAIDIATTLGTYVMGAVLREVQEHNSQSYTEQILADLTEAEREKVFGDFTERVRATGRYPHLAEMLGAGYDPDAAGDPGRAVRVRAGLPAGRDRGADRGPPPVHQPRVAAAARQAHGRRPSRERWARGRAAGLNVR